MENIPFLIAISISTKEMKDKRTLIRLRKSVEVADINPNESVLDIGCGRFIHPKLFAH